MNGPDGHLRFVSTLLLESKAQSRDLRNLDILWFITSLKLGINVETKSIGFIGWLIYLAYVPRQANTTDTS